MNVCLRNMFYFTSLYCQSVLQSLLSSLVFTLSFLSFISSIFLLYSLYSMPNLLPPPHCLPFPKCLLSLSLKLLLKLLLSCFKEFTRFVHAWRKILSCACNLRQWISGPGAFLLVHQAVKRSCAFCSFGHCPPLCVILPVYCCKDYYWGESTFL